MTKREKRLQKLRQNPNNVSFEALQQVLLDFDFELKRSSGSHHTFSITIDGTPHILVVPFRRPVKPVYVREALRLIERINNQEANDDE